MNAQEREAFWKNLCALPGLDLSQDAKQLMAAIRFPKLLFRYRPVNLNSLEALRTNRLYFLRQTIMTIPLIHFYILILTLFTKNL